MTGYGGKAFFSSTTSLGLDSLLFPCTRYTPPLTFPLQNVSSIYVFPNSGLSLIRICRFSFPFVFSTSKQGECSHFYCATHA